MRDTLRTVLRWPLYSPLRLVSVIAAGILLLVLVSSFDGQEKGGASHKVTSGSNAEPSKAASPSSSPSPSPAASPDVSVALDTARTFVDIWASHQEPEKWLQALQPYTTPRLLARLQSTDPDRIDATRAGAAKVTDTGGGSLTSAAVSTDAGAVTVELLWAGDQWLVRDIQPGAQAVE
ncbi:hypothetical protein ACFV2X_47925 [Streptomyces sp. NPDC059679]|uniref:hypothetical protein n=1 Tax=Streptomyces sp. NPDC059679 TaxID=3346903 RepID=UPI0036B7312C